MDKQNQLLQSWIGTAITSDELVDDDLAEFNAIGRVNADGIVLSSLFELQHIYHNMCVLSQTFEEYNPFTNQDHTTVVWVDEDGVNTQQVHPREEEEEEEEEVKEPPPQQDHNNKKRKQSSSSSASAFPFKRQKKETNSDCSPAEFLWNLMYEEAMYHSPTKAQPSTDNQVIRYLDALEPSVIIPLWEKGIRQQTWDQEIHTQSYENIWNVDFYCYMAQLVRRFESIYQRAKDTERTKLLVSSSPSVVLPLDV